MDGLVVPIASSLKACDDGLVDDRCGRTLFHSGLGDKGDNFTQPQDRVEPGWFYLMEKAVGRHSGNMDSYSQFCLQATWSLSNSASSPSVDGIA